MMTKLRSTMIVVAIFLALFLSAANVVPAFADDSVPPTEEVVDGVTPVAAEEEALPSQEETGPAPEEQTTPVEDILGQIPEDTQVIVLDESGEALPLASMEAAETLVVGDPKWCPVGVTPGGAGCSPTYPSFSELIQWLIANPKAVAGVIWVESSYNYTLDNSPILLGGGSFGTTINYALTINGGWSGGNNTLLNANAPSILDVPLIINWNAPVTIKNIVIAGASDGGYAALEVITPGNIILTNVDVVNNTTGNGGALLDNSSGAGLGNVVVTESNFNGNSGGPGLTIISQGTVSLKNVAAIGNGGEGVYIDNHASLLPKTVTLTGFNQFNANGGDGLLVFSKGIITLNNITAMFNSGGSGAYLDNTFAGSISGITIGGTNNFSSNGWDGLRLYTNGAVLLNNITANDNGTDTDRLAATDDGEGGYFYDAFGKGAYIYNWSTVPKPVTLNGTNTFNGNASTGLFLDSNGVVKVNNLTANYNQCDALKDLEDDACAGAYIAGAGVTLTGYGVFMNNWEQGLKVFNAYVPSLLSNAGSISLANLYATNNGSDGVWAVTYGTLPYNITLTGLNVFSDNQGNGLFVWSNGVVTLNNLTANNNGTEGVYVDNRSATTAKAVFINGTNIFKYNGLDGLLVYSYGAITTNNITSMYNAGHGVYLDNCSYNDITELCQGYSPQLVAMNGINVTNSNYENGVEIWSRGAIRFSNLTANNNAQLGAFIVNSAGNSLGGITQTGYGIFMNNYGFSGFNLYSNGLISLTNLTAESNNTYGGVIRNYTTPLKPADVIISGTNNFNNNPSTGLLIETYGTVTLNNVTANGNGINPGYYWDDDLGDWAPVYYSANGVYINNSGNFLSGNVPAVSARPVNLNGVNTFNNNSNSGLVVESFGAIRVNKVTANDNMENGADLYNRNGKFNSSITVVGYGFFNGNLGIGIKAVSNGAISISNVTASDNDFMGAYLDTRSNTLSTPVTVSVLGSNIFNNNLVHGLQVLSDGQITLNSITANGNGGWGAYLDNVTQGSFSYRRNILLTGSNYFVNNSNGGLYFKATGAVSLARVTSAFNGGALSAGIVGTAGNSITLSCSSLFFNEGSGFNLAAGGTITLQGVFGYGNGLSNLASAPLIVSRLCALP